MRSILISLLIFYSATIYGQSHNTDTIENIKLHFRFDKDVFEREYMANNQAISLIENIFRNTNRVDFIDSISISAYASPEGNYIYNEKLAYRRANGIKKYLLLNYPLIDSTLIKVHSNGEDWDGLRQLVEHSQYTPFKDNVLSILRTQHQISRENYLRKVGEGQAWEYIEKHFLPKLRVGATFLVYYNPQKIKELSNLKLIHHPLSLPVKQNTASLELPIVYSQLIRKEEEYRKPLFAIKTNLLADIMTSVNIEIEIPIGKRWSVGAEWMFPWWIFDNNKYYNQLLLGTVEGRYWFHSERQSEVLSGHALGLYASAGYYDFQWKKNGYQGEILPSVGLSYTYAHKMGEYFRMEYSVGFGILNTKYRKYTANDQYDQFPWLSSGRTLWVGPTKAEISFVWLISKRVRNEK